MFKKGDKVKVFCRLGVQKKESWQVATVTDLGGPGQEEFVTVLFRSGQTLCATDDLVRHYKPIDGNVVDKFAADTLESLKKYLDDALPKLFPHKNYSVHADSDEPTILYLRENAKAAVLGTSNDAPIQIETGLSLMPGFKEIEGILGFEEVPAWGVYGEKYYPGSLHEPPSSEPMLLKDFRTAIQAAAFVCEKLYALDAEPYWENVSYDKEMVE